jgi:DNA-binding beta-propeller fold protein YncE
MESRTNTRIEGQKPLWRILLMILFGVSLYLSLGFRDCHGSPQDNVEKKYQGANGVIYTVIYKYFDGSCVGWTIVSSESGQVSSGDNCSAAVPAVRAMTTVSGSAGPGSTPQAGNLRPRATSGSQGVLLLADAFTGVDAFDLATGAELASMPVQGNPIDLVSLPGQNTVYAVIYPSFGASPSIVVIDGTQLKITANIPLPANTFPISGALSPDGATLYVSNAGSSDLGPSPNTSILAIDTVSRTVKGAVPLPAANVNLFGYYQRLAVSPDGSLLYATGSGGYLEAIDTRTLSPVSFILLAPFLFVESGSPAPHIVFAPDGSAAYVAVLGPKGAFVVVINPDTSQPVNSVQIGSSTSYLSDLAITLDGSTLFALDLASGITYPVSTATLTVGTPIPRQNLPGSSTDPIVFSGFAVRQ